jgi:hypothetical protein
MFFIAYNVSLQYLVLDVGFIIKKKKHMQQPELGITEPFPSIFFKH